MSYKYTMTQQTPDMMNFVVDSPMRNRDVEAWIVNSLKVRLIAKLDSMLEDEGRLNARKVFLVPFFTIVELLSWINQSAPEMRTFVYRELFAVEEESRVRFG